MIVERIEKEDWVELSESAHRAVFSESRSRHADRIDYALLAINVGVLQGYCTVRELDSESVYWQYGGAFPTSEKSLRAVAAYKAFVNYTKERYSRVTTLVENTNVAYLKLAMHFGFRIIGCRLFHGQIFVELLLEFNKEEK